MRIDERRPWQIAMRAGLPCTKRWGSPARRRGRSLAVFLLVTAVAMACGPTAGSAFAQGRIAFTTGLTRQTVWVANADGTARQELGPGTSPRISPNGGVVAAAALSEEDAPTGQLILYSVEEATPIAVQLPAEVVTPLAFSPDSKYLAVGEASNVAGKGLAVIDVETGGVTQVVMSGATAASFNPTGGDELVFSRASGSSPAASVNLYKWAPGGGPPKQITNDGKSLFPVWGNGYIAYVREASHHYSPGGHRFSVLQYQIWLMYPNGARRQLTHMRLNSLQTGLVPIAISASGARLVAELDQQDIPMAYAVEVPSGRARPLLRNAITKAAGISSDGSRVLAGHFFYGGEHNAILSIPFSSGRPTVLVAENRVLEPTWNE